MRFVLFLIAVFPLGILPAEDTPRIRFDESVRKILKVHCFGCHGSEKAKADLRIDNLNPDLVDGDDAETWHDILDQINQGEMPPQKAKQPSPEQRQKLTKWLQQSLKQAADAKRLKEGRVSTRRLTGYEYANTMRDLLGIELDFAKDLPPDPASSTGFNNDGATLEMSPSQMEQYLRVARQALSKVIVSDDRPKSFFVTQSETAIGNFPTRNFAGHQPVKPEYVLDLAEFPRSGEFELTITARASVRKGDALPQMRLSMGHVPGIIHVPRAEIGATDVSDGLNTYTFRGRMEDFPQPGPISFGNSGFKGMIVMVDFVDADGDELRYKDRQYAQRPPKPKKKPTKKKPTKKKTAKKNQTPEKSEPQLSKPVAFGSRLEIEITSAEFRSPIRTSWPPPSHRKWIPQGFIENESDQQVRTILKRFVSAAFRRPATQQEINQTFKLYTTLRSRTESYEEAIRETFASVLVSPHFLYIVETQDQKSDDGRIGDYELASRLSYFLWSAPADQKLLDLVKSGEIKSPDVIAEQARRMLADSRAQQFSDRFAEQWFDLDALDRVAVNPEFFPAFDNDLKSEMRRETQAYFREILFKDRSALELIASDWTMANRALARHYGLTPNGSTSFQRVSLVGSNRPGGLLAQGSFLLANANGEDSHPIKRAVWILDRLLDSPPASPPADVPELDSENADFAKLTLKQQLEVHREKESCANCHRGIDPWGIPLENFDAIGLYRTKIPRHKKRPETKVDNSSKFPSGIEINGIVELQRHLIENRSEQFARCVVKRLMAYGLGRSLDFGDREAVEHLTSRFIEGGHKLKSLIVEFVQSDTFQSN